jgi:hypothetical protein
MSEGESHLLRDSYVYIHFGGYLYARVTYLDIENDSLSGVISCGGKFLPIIGIGGCIKIVVGEGINILVYHNLLNIVLSLGERTYTWVGVKEEGIL